MVIHDSKTDLLPWGRHRTTRRSRWSRGCRRSWWSGWSRRSGDSANSRGSYRSHHSWGTLWPRMSLWSNDRCWLRLHHVWHSWERWVGWCWWRTATAVYKAVWGTLRKTASSAWEGCTLCYETSISFHLAHTRSIAIISRVVFKVRLLFCQSVSQLVGQSKSEMINFSFSQSVSW